VLELPALLGRLGTGGGDDHRGAEARRRMRSSTRAPAPAGTARSSTSTAAPVTPEPSLGELWALWRP
jgi:hypothetical protein